MREYIGETISIDGRGIYYRLVTAYDYLRAKHGLDDEECENFVEENYEIYRKLNQIMALKQSCFLLRRTSYSCGSLSDHLYDLKSTLIKELREKYGFEFDDLFVENYGH